ncbi:MAG TPA: hypothetical protein DCZ03_06100 [Gammaproteobacteria bacterium]|nr:hypothetical protein [Gammaproteobacteria bacterium]
MPRRIIRCTTPYRLSAALIPLLVQCVAIMLVQPAMADSTKVLEEWQQIGSGTLKYIGFRLYTASYYENGSDSDPQGRALRIQYHRTIKQEQLLTATEKIWQRMGELPDAQIEDYIARLGSIWPTVEENDELIFLVDSQGVGAFYFNGEYLGEIEDPQLSEAFLGIWLSPKTPNTKLRSALLGLTNS